MAKHNGAAAPIVSTRLNLSKLCRGYRVPAGSRAARL